MMTPESLSREGSPAPQEIILAAPGCSPDQATTISIPDIKTQDIQLGGPAVKLTSGGLQLASLGPGQPLQLTAGGQIVTSNGAPLQPAQLLGAGQVPGQVPGKLIVASQVTHQPSARSYLLAALLLTFNLYPTQVAPRLLVPTLPGQVGGPPPGPGPRLVSLGGVTLTTPTQPQPSRAKQVVSSSTPVLLQPANR